MNIKETQTAEASLKGFTVTGKVVAVYEGKRIQGTKNDKAYDFVATSIKLEDDTGSIYVQFTDKDEELQSVKDKTITCISCSINEYVNKQGITQRSIRANEFSSEITLEDPAHPELPKTVPIKDELTKEELKEVKETTKPIEPSTWDLKDVKIIRQHCETDATSLVIKYFKGTLDEAIAQVITTSNILVSSVYQGLKFPIKVEEEIQEEKPEHTKKFEKEMETATEKLTSKVTEPATTLETKALELKSKIFELTGGDAEFAWELNKMFKVDNVTDLNGEQLAEFVTFLANRVIELEKG